MKKLALLILLLLSSCTKEDKINHYLNEKVTQKELLNNGFYKYTMTRSEGIIDDLNQFNVENGDPVIPSKFIEYRINVYSNISPMIKNGIARGPIPVFKDNKDKIKGKIITYFFRNNILEFKSVMSPITNEKQIELFKTKEDIKNYYNKLKVPIKEIPLERLRNHNDSIGLRIKFINNNYESYFYLSDGNEMVTYYLNKKIGSEDMLVWNFYNENSPYKFIE